MPSIPLANDFLACVRVCVWAHIGAIIFVGCNYTPFHSVARPPGPVRFIADSLTHSNIADNFNIARNALQNCSLNGPSHSHSKMLCSACPSSCFRSMFSFFALSWTKRKCELTRGKSHNRQTKRSRMSRQLFFLLLCSLWIDDGVTFFRSLRFWIVFFFGGRKFDDDIEYPWKITF